MAFPSEWPRVANNSFENLIREVNPTVEPIPPIWAGVSVHRLEDSGGPTYLKWYPLLFVTGLPEHTLWCSLRLTSWVQWHWWLRAQIRGGFLHPSAPCFSAPLVSLEGVNGMRPKERIRILNPILSSGPQHSTLSYITPLLRSRSRRELSLKVIEETRQSEGRPCALQNKGSSLRRVILADDWCILLSKESKN